MNTSFRLHCDAEHAYVRIRPKLMMCHPPGEVARQMKLEGMDGLLHVGDGVPA